MSFVLMTHIWRVKNILYCLLFLNELNFKFKTMESCMDHGYTYSNDLQKYFGDFYNTNFENEFELKFSEEKNK